MICDRFHLLQVFLHFKGKANFSYDPNDGKRGFCFWQKFALLLILNFVLYYPKKQLSVAKSLVLFKCQLHFKWYIKKKSTFLNKTL